MGLKKQESERKNFKLDESDSLQKAMDGCAVSYASMARYSTTIANATWGAKDNNDEAGEEEKEKEAERYTPGTIN